MSEIDNYRFMARAPVVVSAGSGGTSAPPGMAPIPDKILQRIDEVFLGPSAAGGAPASSPFLRNTADLLIGMDRVVPVVERPGQHQETFGGINPVLRNTGQNVND